MFRIAMALTLAFVLSSCANNPVSLGKVEPRNGIVRTYSSYPIYAATDRYSFTEAEVKLSAGGASYHRIQIGDYFLGEVLEILKSSSATLVRLTEFSSKCDRTRVLLPTLLCKTNYLLEIKENGVSRTVGGAIPDVDVGFSLVRQQNVLGIAMNTGDDTYHKKIEPLLLALVEDFKKKVNEK